MNRDDFEKWFIKTTDLDMTIDDIVAMRTDSAYTDGQISRLWECWGYLDAKLVSEFKSHNVTIEKMATLERALDFAVWRIITNIKTSFPIEKMRSIKRGLMKAAQDTD